MASWVKFHRSLRKGAKRAFPRATRFIYLEIAEEAREHGGVLELPPRLSLTDALHDLLGGSRDEIAVAVGEGPRESQPPHLLEPLVDGDEPMLSETKESSRRLLVVRSFEKWNGTRDDSKERVRRHRKEPVTVGNALPSPDVTVCNALQEQRVTISPSSTLISSSEGVQGEPLTATAQDVITAMTKGSDLWPQSSQSDVAKVASVAADQIEDPIRKAGASEAGVVIREALSRAREHKAKYQLADSAQMLARFARIVGWVLDEYQEGKRQRQAGGSDGLHGTTIGATRRQKVTGL